MQYIFHNKPEDWRDLQKKVSEILKGSGYSNVEVEKTISTVRGNVDVDVYADKNREVILCECKYWNKTVPKTTVHSFRTVVQDFGATHGYLVSQKGFQSGAHMAADRTNICLVDWWEFQKIFLFDWLAHTGKIIYEASDSIFRYTDVIPPSRFLERLSEENQEKYWDMQPFYQQIWSMASSLYSPLNAMNPSLSDEDKMLRILHTFREENLDVRDPVTRKEVHFNSFSELKDFLLKHCTEGPQKFKELLSQ